MFPPPLCHDKNIDDSLTLRNHGSHFEKHKAAFEEGAGMADAVMEEERVDIEEPSSPSIEKIKSEEIYKS